MAEDDETAAKVQSGLYPYIKSREQVNYIRRILAAHLGECAQGGLLKSPLALANGRDAHGTVNTDSTPANNIYREYLDALKQNVAAQKDFEAARQYAIPELYTEETAAGASASSGLNERLALLQLHQKRDGLYAVQETLDTLLEQPAADAEFLETDRMLQGTPALPPVPKDVIDTMVIEQSSSPLDIAGQVNQLEKVVLRAKLLLRQEEQLLQEARGRVRHASQPPSQSARLIALGATRDELISWIETELGKASSEVHHTEGDGTPSGQGPGKTHPAVIQSQLDAIMEKYTLYVSARKVLLEMAVSEPQLPQSLSKSTKPTKRASLAVPPHPPMDHLVAPCLASLVAASANHKATVAYRTHISSLLNKTSQNNSRQFRKLAEKSHLLSTFSPSDASGRPGTDSASQASIAAQVTPWVEASDTAKMATLEAVAEAVENGQVALEGLMSTLERIGKITGKDILGSGADEEDAWLGADTPRARRHTRKGSRAISQNSTDPWSKLRGNLGLLGQEGLQHDIAVYIPLSSCNA